MLRCVLRISLGVVCGAVFLLLSGISPVYAGDGDVLWSYSPPSRVRSSPAIAEDGTLYFGTDNDELFALNPDGSFKWKYPIQWGSICAPALGEDGTVYAGGDDGVFYAINSDGTLKWKTYPTTAPIQSSPAIGGDGTLYFGANDGSFNAVSPSKTYKWSKNTVLNVYTSPSIALDDTVYFGTWGDWAEGPHFWAVAADGTVKWKHLVDGDVGAGSAIGTDGTIYFGTWGNSCWALNPDGTLKWKYSTGDQVSSAPAVAADGTVYFSSFDYKLYAFNPNGSVKWTFNAGANIQTSPLITQEGTIYIVTWKGDFFAVNPDGSQKWHVNLGEYTAAISPAVANDGTIYISTNTKMLALEGSSPLASEGWPKFRKNLRNTGRKMDESKANLQGAYSLLFDDSAPVGKITYFGMSDDDGDAEIGYTNSRTVDMGTLYDGVVDAWYISSSDTKPEHDAPGWTGVRPISFTLSDNDGRQTYYIYPKRGTVVGQGYSASIVLDRTPPTVEGWVEGFAPTMKNTSYTQRKMRFSNGPLRLAGSTFESWCGARIANKSYESNDTVIVFDYTTPNSSEDYFRFQGYDKAGNAYDTDWVEVPFSILD